MYDRVHRPVAHRGCLISFPPADLHRWHQAFTNSKLLKKLVPGSERPERLLPVLVVSEQLFRGEIYIELFRPVEAVAPTNIGLTFGADTKEISQY